MGAFIQAGMFIVCGAGGAVQVNDKGKPSGNFPHYFHILSKGGDITCFTESHVLDAGKVVTVVRYLVPNLATTNHLAHARSRHTGTTPGQGTAKHVT